jgi:hypothetical protein
MNFLAQVTFGDTTIPASQALPPAGFNQIAFRPACPQMVQVGQANGLTAWTLPMPDGAVVTLLELPPMALNQAYLTLDSYGLCKVGGDTVPVLYSRQLPQTQIVAPVVAPTQAGTLAAGGTQPADLAPTSETQGGGLIPLIAGSVVLLAIAAGVVAYSRRKPKGIKASTAAPAPEAQPSKATKAPKPPDRTATRRSQLDDLLGGE